MPVLITLVLLLHFFEVNEEAFLLSGSRPEVQLHACVIAVLEASLSLGHPVVEVAIEVRKTLVIEFAGSHAVAEDNSACSFLVHVPL